MGAIIGFEKRVIYTSNSEWEDVVKNAIVVARHMAKEDFENGFIVGLEKERRGFFSGYCPDFDRLFRTRVEKIFWASCFFELSRWLCIGKLPHEEARSPARRVFIAYWCGDLLRHLLNREAGECVFFDHDTQLLRQMFDSRMDDEACQKIRRNEWQKLLDEADGRGVLTAEVNYAGWLRCPFCKRAFTTNDLAAWDGERHKICLTRVNLVPKI